MSFEIRKANAGDFEALIALFTAFSAFEKHPEKMTNSVSRMHDEQAHFHAFVATSPEGTIVGYAAYVYTYQTWSGKSMYLDDLYVQESHRKLGLGKRLLEAVIALAREEKCHKLRWMVSNWNHNAQQFYKSIGATLDDTLMNCELSLT